MVSRIAAQLSAAAPDTDADTDAEATDVVAESSTPLPNCCPHPAISDAPTATLASKPPRIRTPADHLACSQPAGRRATPRAYPGTVLRLSLKPS